MVTPDSFKVRFPEFSSIDDGRVQLALDDASLIVDETRYATKYDLAIAYHAAHELKVATDISSSPSASSNVGPVSSKSAGGVSVSRAVSSIDLSSGDAYYQTSTYGIKFLSIRNLVRVPGFMAINLNGLQL